MRQLGKIAQIAVFSLSLGVSALLQVALGMAGSTGQVWAEEVLQAPTAPQPEGKIPTSSQIGATAPKGLQQPSSPAPGGTSGSGAVTGGSLMPSDGSGAVQ